MLINRIAIRKCAALLITVHTLSLPLWASAVPIPFAKALEFALVNNPGVLATKASIEGAKGAAKQADSMQWPKLSLELNGARTDNPMTVFGYKLSQGNASFADFGANEYTGPSTLYTKPAALNHPGYYSNLDTAFKLTVPLYAGGAIKARQAQMRALLISARRGNQHAKNQLAYEVYSAYERFLTARDLVELAEKQTARAREFVSAAYALKKQSLALESDVLMAETYLHSALLGLTNAKIQADDELDVFRTLLGKPASAFVPSRHTTLSTNTNMNAGLMLRVMHQNPSVTSLRARLEAEKAAILASQALYKPQVSVQLRHDWNGNTIGSGLPSDTVALGANWTLFSAGERAGAVQRASARAKKVQFELDEQRNQLQLQLKQLQRAERQTLYTLQLSRTIAEKEEAIMQKLTKRYGRGLVPLSALLESQLKLTQSKAQTLQALHQSRLHQAHWLMLGNQLIPKAIKNT